MLLRITMLLAIAASSLADAQSVKFGRSTPSVGDVTEQSSRMALDMTAVTRAADQVLEQSQVRMQRQQVRQLEALELDSDGRVVAARVSFSQSRRGTGDDPPTAQAIEGRTYHCRRTGEDLAITRDDGSVPTPDEVAQVTESVDSLGRVNPLAQYLAGRTLHVSEKLLLPPEVGAGLMSRDAVGEVVRFELTLSAIVEDATGQVAQFNALVETREQSTRQLGLLVTGQMAIEVATCRTRSLTLAGPIAMAETTGGIGTPTQLHGTGKLEVALEASYPKR